MITASMPFESVTSPTAPVATSANEVTPARGTRRPTSGIGWCTPSDLDHVTKSGRQVVGPDVELHIAKTVGPQSLRDDGRVVDLRERDHARKQQIGVDEFTKVKKIDAVAQVRCSRSKDVTPIERRSWRLELILEVCECNGPSCSSDHRNSRSQHTIIGTDEHPFAIGNLDGDTTTSGTNARIDHRNDDARGDIANRTGQRERSSANVERHNAMCEVDHSGMRSNLTNHRLDHADEFVGRAIVGKKGDRVVTAAHVGIKTTNWTRQGLMPTPRWHQPCRRYPLAIRWPVNASPRLDDTPRIAM
jgi:hypothetical protein